MAFIIGVIVGFGIGYFMWGRQVGQLQSALDDALRGNETRKEK